MVGDMFEAHDALVTAVTRTFEGMSFQEVLARDPKEVDPFDEYCFTAAIDLVAPLSGKLTMFVPEDLGVEVAKAVFGIYDHVEDSMIKDALGEMLNTLAGQFMSALTSGDHTFEIGLPVLGMEEDPELEGRGVPFHFHIDQEDFAVVLSDFK